jgi:hypothetical protein
MNSVRLTIAALCLPVLALACSKGAVGANPGAVPSLISDPTTSNYASVQANGSLNEVPGNVAPFFSTGGFGNVKNGPGAVYSMQVISRDITPGGAYLQLQNNVWVEAGAQPTTVPIAEIAIPAASDAGVNYPGSVVVGTFAPQAAVFMDAGINYCVSSSSITCTPVADAGAYNVMIQYQ